jgi:hypothetical protein
MHALNTELWGPEGGGREGGKKASVIEKYFELYITEFGHLSRARHLGLAAFQEIRLASVLCHASEPRFTYISEYLL